MNETDQKFQKTFEKFSKNISKMANLLDGDEPEPCVNHFSKEGKISNVLDLSTSLPRVGATMFIP